ncbi:MAG: UDP-N-acetylmuramate:L-alanyl-gamma-D-glutamyl-meso-diaminopimelate ligase, partial [Gammaproteobacteria bacterium]
MHIHILGICGTFMGGIAAIAREAGHTVTGCDANVYPPMSTQLSELGVTLNEGYHAGHLQPAPDCVVIGNALSRGNPAVEYVLNQGLPYTSGPEWLAQHILCERWVLAVAGTHGKTTTSSMLAWILEHVGLEPGFLIGGVAQNFGVSARLGKAPFFVIEADEYDSAFFDKRSKFIHYRPRTAILNNLEFDHADIFSDLDAIEQQFHHFMRTIPGQGLAIVNGADAALARVLARGCWTPVERFGVNDGWNIRDNGAEEGFDILHQGQPLGRLRWGLLGAHNRMNAIAAIAAARHAGVTPAQAIGALQEFQGVRRRMEVRGSVNGVTVYDDFAHHPTAIATTLHGLRRRAGGARILAVLEPR